MPGVLFTFEASDEGDVRGIQCPADRVLLLKTDFGGEGQVMVKRETWTTTSRTGDAVGSRTQITLCLMWGVTCHKSQGLTLPSAVIHCTKEFVPGLLYVSMTRVKSANHLKVIDFNQRQLLPPVAECINVSENHEEISECGPRMLS